MPTAKISPAPTILVHAERELGAFLLAAIGLVGSDGLSQARDLWIETLRDADCPEAELTDFFRGVTIRTISQLANGSAGWLPTEVRSGNSPLNVCA